MGCGVLVLFYWIGLVAILLLLLLLLLFGLLLLLLLYYSFLLELPTDASTFLIGLYSYRLSYPLCTAVF